MYQIWQEIITHINCKQDTSAYEIFQWLSGDDIPYNTHILPLKQQWIHDASAIQNFKCFRNF
jgi:hypothetical protein